MIEPNIIQKLGDTLKKIGIAKNIVKLIMACVSTSFMKSFKPIRGIRQRDPLSSYLFVMCIKMLAYCINHAI